MPRFLNTTTGEFEWHVDPRKVYYAILSHTWRSFEDGGEQSYGEVRILQAEVAAKVHESQLAVVCELKLLRSFQPSHIPHPSTQISLSTGPICSSIFGHTKLSAKIKGICKVARQAGFELIWIDSCCIDKESSVELSEAINSMFGWYTFADKCYVYLEDVFDGDSPRNCNSGFWRTRWHTRCWTLQELIAPKEVEFLSQTWCLLGTKLGLAVTLGEITGVDCDILTGHTTLDSVSVARRMSWAAKRKATRLEDIAYSLLGLFDIHMSPIYGEGMNAFLRLQEEIVRTIPDQSIFAWGSSCTLQPPTYSFSSDDNQYDTNLTPPGSLFASSPRDFKGCQDIVPVSSFHFSSMLGLQDKEDVPPIHCVFTPQGVRVQLLRLNIAEIPKFMETFRTNLRLGHCSDCSQSQAATFAFLQCQDGNGSLVALPLCSPREETNRGMIIGIHTTCPRWWHVPDRTVRMTRKELVHALSTLR